MKAHHRMNVLLFLVGSLVVAGMIVSLKYAPPSNESTGLEEVAPIEITRSYEYDDNNRLVAVKYSDGTHVRFVYDAQGRMVERKQTREPVSEMKQVVLK